MKLEGMHHITMITSDAQKNVEFYADVLGLRLVKTTVNFDDPTAYHLYFGDERGSPGTILTWFEYAGVRPGRAGAGMIHTIQLGVGADASLDFWAERLTAKGYPSERGERSLAFRDYEGLRYELVVAHGHAPLRAVHPEIPAEHAIAGVEGARAHPGSGLNADRPLLTDTLGFSEVAEGQYRLQGNERHFHWRYDEAPAARGVPGGGTVHHIAWHSPDEDHVAWRQKVAAAGMRVTPVIDRDYFYSVYFRQPQGILFELATTSPGFAVDEDPEHLGEELRLPRQHEVLRPQLERRLTPLTNPRAARRVKA